ncbi:MAG: chromosome segregation protein SMC [Lachnospiraceae bacterium]
MYLKSIEVQGFKSFANKIVFNFHNGITGIVGPNGSGKSNVADAVRWVLGEQRIKQLRGASMQDVIFSGTEMRKPLGYAYVAITLDNSDHQLAIDYEEVTIARKLYRSGESEYLLNGTVCRLKDVNELFYDTGIGKEGYSIIGQGQIDKILSGKPEERRELFDEAAGIVKFKKRKNTAQKKLEEEKANLLRVNDILSELEKQIGPLERQSEKAKEYLKKKEELKRLDVNYFLLENENSTGALTRVETNLENATNDLESQKEQMEKVKAEYDSIQTVLEQLETDIEETKNSLNTTSETKTKLIGEINVLKEKINSAKGNSEHFISRMEALEAEITAKNEQKIAFDEKKAQADTVLKEAEEQHLAARNDLEGLQKEIDVINQQMEGLKDDIYELLNERTGIRTKKERFDTLLEQTQIRRANINSMLLQAKSDEEEQQQGIEKFQEEFALVNKRIEELRMEQVRMEERAGQIHDELAEKDRILRDTQVQYHQAKTKLESITNLTERYEGYGNGIRKVMEKKETEKGIVGVVADIIKVEKKYEVAIETALGGNIQNVVTDDEDTAKKMIQYLKETRNGRVTFLPLTSITKPQEFKNPESLKEPGVIGMACDIVQTEKKYENVAKAMLGRIVVVDHVDNALKIARKFEYGIRMVTLEGELLVPGGAISGGNFKNSSNLLSRRREMDELEKQVKDYLHQINGTLDEIEQVKKERNQLRIKIEEIKGEIQKEVINQNTARLNVIKLQEKIDEALQGVDKLKNEQMEIDVQVKDIKDQQSNLDEELKQSVQKEKDLENALAEKHAQMEEKRVVETEYVAHVNQQEVKAEKARQAQQYEQENVSRVLDELNRYKEEQQEIRDAIRNNEIDVEENQNNIKKLEETIAASQNVFSESEMRLNDMLSQKETYAEKQKQFFQNRESLMDQMNHLDKEVYRLTGQRDKLRESIDGLIAYMWSEYEMTLRDAVDLKDDSLNDLVFIKRSIAEMKDSIKRLGDVNVNAIEDYKTVMERYTQMKTQHDDLVEAEKYLNGIIEELDNAMRKQFSEKFEDIKKEFDKVFKELFGGGKANLELMEDEDILEAGIRIIAQPPGKKLQNMMQLSGGEKALAAIALMFAIQNLKPSPFCLLDEIEAALDESNVGRFAGYLHKLTKHTQFIVITHRRGTMEKADRLYGITMQEKGVSTLVSVNLIDSQLDN